MTSPASSSKTKRAYVALASAGTLWGLSFPLGKIALEDVGPGYLVLYRFVLATAILVPFVPRKRPNVSHRDLGLLVLGGFLMGPMMFLLQFAGLNYTTASSAALLVGTIPPMMAIAAFFVDDERPDKWTWMAIGVSAIGVGLLVGGPGIGRTLLGDGLVFISLVASVVWTLLTRRVARRVGVLSATTILFAVGTLFLLPFALLMEGQPPLAFSVSTWGAVIALGLICTALTFWLWNWGLQHAGAAQAGVFTNLEPLVGALLGVLWLGEQLGPLALAGGSLVVGAAFLVSRTDSETT